MAKDNFFKRLRAVIGNAVVWGVSWSALWVLAVTAFVLLGLVGITPGLSLAQALGAIIRFGTAFGVIGFVTGGAFSALFGLLYRGRRLSEISWIRVGIGGAVASGLFVPLFLQAMNLLSGDGLVAWELVLDDGLWTAVFGGVAAGGSIKLAQLSGMLPDGGRDRIDRAEGGDRLPQEVRQPVPYGREGEAMERLFPDGRTIREVK